MTDDFKEEHWTYIGRRTATKGYLLAVYLDGDGEEIAWKLGKGILHRVIGATYAVEVCRDGESVSARVTEAKFVDGPEARDERRVGEWATRDRAAYTTDLTTKREAKAKRESDSFGAMSMEDLRGLYLKVPYGQQTALIAQVIRYMQMSRT